MAPSRRRGTLGDHDGNQRGKAADRMEPQRARQPCHAGFLGWIGASPPVRSACETSFRVPMAGTVSPSFRVPAAQVRRGQPSTSAMSAATSSPGRPRPATGLKVLAGSHGADSQNRTTGVEATLALNILRHS